MSCLDRDYYIALAFDVSVVTILYQRFIWNIFFLHNYMNSISVQLRQLYVIMKQSLVRKEEEVMIRLGTIGTSWITAQFIEAAQASNLYHVRAVYSRQAEKAYDLAQRYGINYYSDELNHLLFDPEIDAIYVASPNSLHFDLTMRAIRAGKHVIVEKPMFASAKQWREAHALAKEMNVLLFEAVVHVHGPNYKRLKQLVHNKLGELKRPFLGANLNIGQYSSKYPDYAKAMEAPEYAIVPNIFNLDFAGGTLMDIGVYPLYVAIDLFGMPMSVRYYAMKGANMIDLFGNIILSYDNYQINLFISKAVHSVLPSEIYMDDETIVIEGITRIDKVHVVNTQGQAATIIDYKPSNPMAAEVEHFAEMMMNRDDVQQQILYENWTQLSLQVAQVMEEIRQSANIKFD